MIKGGGQGGLKCKITDPKYLLSEQGAIKASGFPSVRPAGRLSVHNFTSTLAFKSIKMTYSLKPLHL